MMTLYKILCLVVIVIGGEAWIFPQYALSRSICNSRALTLASTESRSSGLDPEAIARIRAVSLTKQRELKESATVVEGLEPLSPAAMKKVTAAAKKKKTSSTPRKRKTPEEKEAEILQKLEREEQKTRAKELEEELKAERAAAIEEAKLKVDANARELRQAKLSYNYTDALGNASTVPFIKASKWYAIKVPTGLKAATIDHLKSGLITDATLEYIPRVAMHRSGVLKNTLYLYTALAKNDYIYIRSSVMHPKIVKALEKEVLISPEDNKRYTLRFERNQGYIVPVPAGRIQDIIDSENIENYPELSEKLSQITIGSFVTLADFQEVGEVFHVDDIESGDDIAFGGVQGSMYYGRVEGTRQGKIQITLFANDVETTQRRYYPLELLTLTDRQPKATRLQRGALENKLKKRAKKLKLKFISTYKELDAALFDRDGDEGTDLQLQIEDGSIDRFLQDDKTGDWEIDDPRQFERFLAIHGVDHPFLKSFVNTQMFTDIMHARGARKMFEKYLLQYDPDYFIRQKSKPRPGGNTREYDEIRIANRELRQFDRQYNNFPRTPSSQQQDGNGFDDNMVYNLVQNAAKKAMFTVEKNMGFDDDFAWGSGDNNIVKSGSKQEDKEHDDVFEEDFSFLDDLIPASDSSKSSSVSASAASSGGSSSIDDFFDDDFIVPLSSSKTTKSKDTNTAFDFDNSANRNVNDEVDDLLGLLEDDDNDDFQTPPTPKTRAAVKPTTVVKEAPPTGKLHAFIPSLNSNSDKSNKKWKPKDTEDMSIDDFLDSFTSSSSSSTPPGQGQGKGDYRLDSLISELDDMLGDTSLNFNAEDDDGGSFEPSKLFSDNAQAEQAPEQDYEDFMKHLEQEFSGMEDYRLDMEKVNLASSASPTSSTSSSSSSIIDDIKDKLVTKKPRATKKTSSTDTAVDTSGTGNESEVKKKPVSKRSKKSVE